MNESGCRSSALKTRSHFSCLRSWIGFTNERTANMKAVVTSFNRAQNYWQVRTTNDIAIAFSIEDSSILKLNEEVEVDLPNVVSKQELQRMTDGKIVRIRLHDYDLHDLRLPSGHGTSRKPSTERLNEA